MKKTITLALAIVALASCNKQENDFEMQGNDALRITSGIETRAVGNTWELNDAIGVSMLNTGTATVIGTANTQYSAEPSGGGSSATFASANFAVVSPNSDLYYPQLGNVDVRAYYPYSDNTEDGTSYKLDMVTEQTDLMVAKATDVSKSREALSLTFKHLMSKINVSITAGDGLTDADIAEGNVDVTLAGTNTKATYNLAAFDPANSTSTAPISELTNVAELTLVVTGTSAECLSIPQTLSNASLVFDVNNYGTFAMPLTTTAFISGSNHNYTVRISRTGVELTGSNITDWAADNDDTDNNGTAAFTHTVNEEGTWEIHTTEGLDAFCKEVNNGNRSLNAKLMRNITYEPNPQDATATNFTMINHYSGTFDGNGKTISGVVINKSSSSEVGIFGSLFSSGEIKNLGVINSKIAGQYVVGGIVGTNMGGTLTSCYNSGAVSGERMIGGIVGLNIEGTLSSCYNSGAMGGEYHIGGIVGANDEGTLSSCYNSGAVSGESNIGGVVGDNNKGTLTSCYNSGAVSGRTAGGIAARNREGILTSCCWVDILGDDADDGVIFDDVVTKYTTKRELNTLGIELLNDGLTGTGWIFVAPSDIDNGIPSVVSN